LFFEKCLFSAFRKILSLKPYDKVYCQQSFWQIKKKISS